MKCLIPIQTIFLILMSVSALATAAQYQKPGAPIRLAEPDYFVSLDPFSQQTVTVNFDTPSKGELYISAKPKHGISITDDTTNWHFDLSAQAPQVTFTVQANETGKYYIMFHARIIENNLSSSRVFGIPVVIGDADLIQSKQKPKPKKDFVIMKAEEKITQH